LASEKVRNEYDARLEDVQLLYTVRNRLGCTSGSYAGKQILKCVSVKYVYCTNEQAEDYCLVVYEKRQCRLAAWCRLAGEPAVIIHTAEYENTLLPRY
jgi:hypothetical protein